MNEQRHRYDYLVRQAANGWIVSLGSGPLNTVQQEFVFRTLDEMNDWLKARHPEQEG